VDRAFQDRGLGAALLADAARRALSAAPAAFYRHHGFQPLASAPQSWFLPLATAAKALPVQAEN
jgi:GNAT superfamily N-acetyltransferase